LDHDWWGQFTMWMSWVEIICFRPWAIEVDGQAAEMWGAQSVS
jgi:hypothetical protein